MMRRSLVMAAAMLAMLSSAGCTGRIIREAGGAVLGAKSSVVEVNKLSPMPGIGPVAVEPIGNAMGRPDVPTRLLTQELRKAVAENKQLNMGGNPVTVSGDVIHYETLSTVGALLSPDPEVVVRMTVKDASGNVIGVANIVGRARSTTSGSVKDLTEGFANGTIKWLTSAIIKQEAGNAGTETPRR